MRGLHLRGVVHVQKLYEMIVNRRASEMFARAQEFLPRASLASHSLTHPGALRPCTAPVRPCLDRRGYFFEIRQDHPIADETGSPMGYGGFNIPIGAHT